jgi:SAM-dependent methyltransferase
MQEILDHLPPGARVLDLGSNGGSFDASAYGGLILIAADLAPTRQVREGFHFVVADAACLPFRARSFDAVVLNHSLEHFEKLKPALQEAGRILRKDAAAYIAVPDATTFSDRLYRKVFRSRGGHVNLFGNERDLARMLSWYLGLDFFASRTLLASLSFLNRKAGERPSGQRPFTRLPESLLSAAVTMLRWLDGRFGWRLGVYGWALYLGKVKQPVDAAIRCNVCVRCGGGHPAAWLVKKGAVRRGGLLRRYACPECGAVNFFLSEDAR